MKKDLITAVVTIVLLIGGLLMLIAPEIAGGWLKRLAGVYILIEGIVKGVPLVKEYWKTKVINKAINK